MRGTCTRCGRQVGDTVPTCAPTHTGSVCGACAGVRDKHLSAQNKGR